MAKKRGKRPNRAVVRTSDDRRTVAQKVVSNRLQDATGQKKTPISRELRAVGSPPKQKQGISETAAIRNKRKAATREPLQKRGCTPRPKNNKSKGGGSRRFAGKYC